MTVQTDLQRRETRVTLGETVLPVGHYETECSVPVVRKTCISGEPHTVLLDEIPCTVTLTGTLRRSDILRIAGALHAAMQTHEAFAFVLDGMQFLDMKLTALRFQCQGNAQTADYTLTMIGGMRDADSP